ncbi:hypothetical protein [Planomonospora sp. ID82291]|uniref:hypothetical protein n=1 Tax=Planomonospora sp. ID82291 TaxID=2738136 RepID=UPI0018C398A8|nr:hypothetical protein [Planomonospora sp. ID82291]MBG0815931.1 hypothetical protein [Planomonospora sp. ID82291]
MTSTITRDAGIRLTGALLLASLITMIAAVAIVVPAGLTLNPADPAGALAAVNGHTGLHLAELALDVLAWLALTAAGLVLAAGPAAAGGPYPAAMPGGPPSGRPGGPSGGPSGGLPGALPGGLLAATGLAGLLHDAGNLAVTQLAADPADPTAAAVAAAVLLTAKWAVNLTGLLWAAATAAAAACLPLPRRLRLAGAVAVLCGLAAVALPWTTGTGGPSPELEQLGYGLQLPVMLWYGVLGVRFLRDRGR